jgi:hypothetical protein
MADSSSGIAGVLVGVLIVGVVLVGALFLTGTIGGGGDTTVKIDMPRSAPSTATNPPAAPGPAPSQPGTK